MGENDDNNVADLPPGFRFYPTDKELLHFLLRKITTPTLTSEDPIPDLGLYAYDPWQLNGKALREGKHWYFYGRRAHENRTTINGYWKPSNVDGDPIDSSTGDGDDKQVIGVKKYYVFHLLAPASTRTSWIMHEYRLLDDDGDSTAARGLTNGEHDDKWVLCRVYEQDWDNKDNVGINDGMSTELSCLDEMFLSLDNDLDGVSFPN